MSQPPFTNGSRLPRILPTVTTEQMRERARWLKALDDSHLPHLYRRLVRDLALAPCDNCGGDPASCDCDES